MSFLTDNALNAGIKSMPSASKKHYDKVQELLLTCAMHTTVHGQTKPLNALLSALGNGARREAFIAWAKEHAYVTFDSAKKEFALNKSKRKADGVGQSTDLVALETFLRAQTAWYDCKPESTHEPATPKKFDSLEFINKALEKLTKEHQEELVKYLAEGVNNYKKAMGLTALAILEAKRTTEEADCLL